MTPATRGFSVETSSSAPSADGPGAPAIPNSAPAALPSNAFGFGKLIRNRRNGSATLVIFVPGPGKLELRGKGLRGAARPAGSAGPVTLPIRPRRGLLARLRRDGSASVSALATYLPAGGIANSRIREFRLLVIR